MELRLLAPKQLDGWRRKYRERLGLPVIPEFHEALCQLGKAYAIEEAGHQAGYLFWTPETFLTDAAPVIPEIYLEVPQAREAKTLLRAVFARLRPRTVMGRTDDAAGFPLLMDLQLPNQISAALYALDNLPLWIDETELQVVPSTLEDAHLLLPVYASVPPEEGGLPDERSLAKSLAAWRHYRLMTAGEIKGVSYVVPLGQQYFTVATIVSAAFRRQGFGRHLTAYVLRQELDGNRIYVSAPAAHHDAARGLAESLGARLAAHFVNFNPEGLGE